MEYKAVSHVAEQVAGCVVGQAAGRFADRLNNDKKLSARVEKCLRQMSNVEGVLPKRIAPWGWRSYNHFL